LTIDLIDKIAILEFLLTSYYLKPDGRVGYAGVSSATRPASHKFRRPDRLPCLDADSQPFGFVRSFQLQFL
jgi:hypothetical protein